MLLTRETKDDPDDARSGSGARPGRVTTRMTRPRWSDARIWAAAGLLAVAAILGSLMMGREGGTVLVMQAPRDLAAGAPVAGLEAIAVPAGIAGPYLTPADADQALASGIVLRWPLAAGELVPTGALAGGATAASRLVSVPVDPLHAPAGLSAGDIVDVWVTDRDESGLASSPTDPELVLGSVRVTAVVTEGVGFAGGWGVELAVPQEQVERVVAASRTGVLDLVTVPASSQAVLP